MPEQKKHNDNRIDLKELMKYSFFGGSSGKHYTRFEYSMSPSGEARVYKAGSRHDATEIATVSLSDRGKLVVAKGRGANDDEYKKLDREIRNVLGNGIRKYRVYEAAHVRKRSDR